MQFKESLLSKAILILFPHFHHIGWPWSGGHGASELGFKEELREVKWDNWSRAGGWTLNLKGDFALGFTCENAVKEKNWINQQQSNNRSDSSEH